MREPPRMSLLSAVIIGSFLAIPLYRPVLMVFNAIPVIYGLFAAVAAIQLIHARTIVHAGKPGVLLLLFALVMIFSTALASTEAPVDLIGLLLFLPISFLLGLTVWSTNRINTVMHTILVIFVPVALYVVYRLSMSGFSYNTYMNWSNAAFRINYLDFSLYGVALFIFYATGKTSLWKRLIVCVPLVLTVFISGARYSILFTTIFLAFVILSTIKTPQLRRQAVIWLFAVIAIILVMGGVIQLADYYQYFEYSLFRMTNALGSDESISGRLALIDRSLSVGIQHLLTGHGIGGSRAVLGGAYPHNFLLEAFLDGGLFAALALATFTMTAIVLPLRYVPRGERWAIGLALFMTGAFLKSFSIYESRILFFTLGYLFAHYAYRIYRRPYPVPYGRQTSSHRSPRIHDALS